MILQKCVVCDNKKSRFIKDKETRGILSSILEIKHL